MASWHVAHITSVNRALGTFEVYCSKFGAKIQGKLSDIKSANFKLNDRVRVFIDEKPYMLHIKMILPSKR